MTIPSGYEYIDSTGVIVADTADIKAEVEAEWVTTFGADINLDPSTPQGLQITADTVFRSSFVRNNADVANQINPNLAGGVFLDAIGGLTGFERTSASTTFVPSVALTGVPGSSIIAGSRAKTAAGDLFESLSTVVLDGSGNATVDFQSVVSGAIPCAVNTLTNIVDAVLGWETVNNPNAATVGTETQSDAQYRIDRNNQIAIQGSGTANAVFSRVSAVTGVLSLQFRENIHNITETIDGVSLVANSVWVCVQGGTDADVGQALLAAKSSGSGWNGSTSVSVVEPNSGQVYTVSFDRPTPEALYVRATIRQIVPVVNVADAVKTAILTWAVNGVPGIPGCIVGNDISPIEISAAITAQIQGLFVQKIELSDDGATWQTIEYPIAINEVATIASTHISVIVS